MEDEQDGHVVEQLLDVQKQMREMIELVRKNLCRLSNDRSKSITKEHMSRESK